MKVFEAIKEIFSFCFFRFLQGNQIRSVTKKSFTGLDLLERL